MIPKDELLKEKRILIVDDEPDVLETLEELLPMCHVIKASTFQEAKDLLEAQPFDMAIFDIMGVSGYELLELANRKKVSSMMLTAHALSVENTIKSYKKGAASYIPKNEMSEIKIYLTDVLEAKDKGEHFWWRWMDRLGDLYDKKFGPGWQEKDKDFWTDFPSW